jgi:indolepyruvate ferredoxin oxidoreductase beta subunit
MAEGSPHQASGARSLNIAVLAMGGEGGGVLADWLVDLGEHNGHLAQATSVPGVAQRTGATIYYVELFPQAAADAAGRSPVLALMPVPGEVDVVIASELMEAGRAIQRGLVDRARTTLIASTHRVYSIGEKMAMGDGRVDSRVLIDGGRAAAREFIADDFARIAEEAGSVISAVLFGALAGSGCLPFAREAFEDAIRRSGIGVQASLAAFGRGYEAAQRGRAVASPGAGAPAAAPGPQAANGTAVAAPSPASAAGVPPVGPRLQPLAQRVQQEFPSSAAATLVHGLLRLADYQDVAYAAEYLDLLAPFARLDGVGPATQGAAPLLDTVGRGLALWMSYEDAVRVADLKTRRSRFERVGREVRLRDGQLLEIREFLHPRVEEIADILPAAWGRRLLAGGWMRALVARFTREGRILPTTSLRGYLALYGVAALRRFRRSSLRFGLERSRMVAWLQAVQRAASTDLALAVEIAECQRLVKGYGDTHARGTRHFEQVMAAAEAARGRPDAAERVRRLRTAALDDESGAALAAALEA